MFIRWNNSSKIWTTGMGRTLTPAELVGLDTNFRTTILTPAKGDVPSKTTDVLVIITDKGPLFVESNKGLAMVDMALIERSSIAHPARMPVLCSPAYTLTHRKMNRKSFLILIDQMVGRFAKKAVIAEGPFGEDEKITGIDFKTISYNDLRHLEDHCVVFVTDPEGVTGMRYLYIETSQYDYLCRPQADVVWVRKHDDSDDKQTWNSWNGCDWITVSEDIDELRGVLDDHF